MDNLDNPKMPKNANVYECLKCNFKCSKNSNYTVHLTTAKHKRIMADNPIMQSVHQCQCGKIYKHMSGLCKHKKTCSGLDENTLSEPVAPQSLSHFMDPSIVIELLKQNQEFKELMMEQSKQLADQQYQNQLLLEQQHAHNSNLLEAVKDGKIGNTTNNTNCNNKFNLNVFLNETCKDAITMDDFINSFEVTREDFLHTGTVGFVEGISTVMTHRFRDMDMHTRPLHCTDLKRETIYIKNADKWEKDDADKTHMRKAVRGVAKKNMKELWRWFHDSKPAVEQIGTDECENYFKYHKSALGGYGKEEDLKFEEKIIKNVLKEVQVDKNALTVA
jgi:hypothetical protein